MSGNIASGFYFLIASVLTLVACAFKDEISSDKLQFAHLRNTETRNLENLINQDVSDLQTYLLAIGKWALQYITFIIKYLMQLRIKKFSSLHI